MKYTIYQIKHPTNENESKLYCKYLFSPLSWIDRVHFDYYREVWNDNIDGTDIYEILEEIFTIFNIKHPKNFHGHSLSVSDIIEINGEYYYCDDMGWAKINIE